MAENRGQAAVVAEGYIAQFYFPRKLDLIGQLFSIGQMQVSTLLIAVCYILEALDR